MDFKALLQHEIYEHELRAPQIANSRVAKRVRDLLPRIQGWGHKYRLVIPARQILATGITTEIRLLRLADREIVWVADLVGPVAAAPGIAQIARHARGECLPALRAGNATDLPSANDCISHTSQITEEMPPPPNWQFINVAHHKAVPEVRQYRAILPLRMVRVLDCCADIAIGVPQIVGQSI